MTESQPARRYRFGVFEADASTGELRRQGVRVKLNAQPFQMLCLLLERPGTLLTREEISRELWPDGTFVDYEHGVNSAVNRIREALGDTASSPRFVETLARRGYRFVAPVERIEDAAAPGPILDTAGDAHAAFPGPSTVTEAAPVEEDAPLGGILATAQELPKISIPLARTFFVLFQIMYAGFYIGALANLAEIGDLFAVLPKPTVDLDILIVTAVILLPVRAFVLAAVLLRAPGMREKLLRLWLFLLPFDVLWALAPFLLLHHINFGLALACTALLAWSPFAQRSLILMGAGDLSPSLQPNAR
ncbi:MAG TPA: winged helix-turn-helix domain-containing protein [Acidobacteriaceae bacterium]|jgi:DNA-binding winged helix-turn-helix (wHTH) protein|nr:winged helix-turn-helix domain-containing protein [Acidobacteriaceae bacterium]